jgi:hypothetical protein
MRAQSLYMNGNPFLRHHGVVPERIVASQYASVTPVSVCDGDDE